jgi:Cu-processing system permease protein
MSVLLGRGPTLDGLSALEVRLALRGRAPILGALLFGAAAAVTAVIGLAAFRQVGLGAVTPAAMALLELSITLPTLIAIVVGAMALQGDGGSRAMLRAAGMPAWGIVLAKACALIATSAVTVTAGYGAAALVLAGSLGPRDLAPFGFLILVTLMVAIACGSIGLLVSALARERSAALLGAIATWAVLAIGVDLVLIVLAPAVRGGTLLAVAALLDPIEAARIAGLLALGADGHVLGTLGAYVGATMGSGRAALALLAALATWIAVPAALACIALSRRETA